MELGGVAMDYRHEIGCLARVPTTIYHVWYINSSFLEARSNITCIILHKNLLVNHDQARTQIPQVNYGYYSSQHHNDLVKLRLLLQSHHEEQSTLSKLASQAASTRVDCTLVHNTQNYFE